MDTPAFATDLKQTVKTAAAWLAQIGEEQAEKKPAPDKWSAKEIIGHLIDSACNNHRRFVTASEKDNLVFDGYRQEEWVNIQRYQEANWIELVSLWKFYNLHLANIMATIPSDQRNKQLQEHNFHLIAWKTIPPDQPTTLAYFMEDYVGHLKHHLQLIKGLMG